MTRFKLIIEYDGTDYCGWQRQAAAHTSMPSVQAEIEAAIQAFCGQAFCGQAGTLFVAGRTDAGVHARGQVAHVDLPDEIDPRKICDAVNFHLKPQPIAVLHAEAVADAFHARFSARERHYLYRIINRRAPLALEHNRAWFVPQKLDVEAMRAAAPILQGQHDFTTFRSVHCQSASPIKTVHEIRIETPSPDNIDINVSAPSFLHHQIRSFIGCLKFVGTGKWTADDLAAARNARDRQKCAALAPACGLYFMQVDY